MNLKVNVEPTSFWSSEQDRYVEEMIRDGCLKVNGSEYTATTGWTVWALHETGLLVQDRAEPYIVDVLSYCDRSNDQDQLIEEMRGDGYIVKVQLYHEPDNWSGPVYEADKNLYALVNPAAYYLLGSKGLLVGVDPTEPVYVPESLLTPSYAHDNSFFKPYNVEVSSADAQTVTNDQGGKQSYQPGAFELLPPIALTEVAKVLEHGAYKYEDWNWTAIPSHMHLRSAMGHVFSFIAGDTTEGNDRYNHLTHAATRLLFAVEMYARETGRFTKAK